MKKAVFFISILSFLSSCKKDDSDVLEIIDTGGIQINCNEINEQLYFWTYERDTLNLDVNENGIADIIFIQAGYFGSSGSYEAFYVDSREGFEIAFVNYHTVTWVYGPPFYPDTVFNESDNITVRQYNEYDIISGDSTNFSADQLYFYSRSESGSMPPDPFEHGSETDNPWNYGDLAYMIFRNPSLGIMGWLKIDYDGYPTTIIRSHFEITNTLVIEESVCD